MTRLSIASTLLITFGAAGAHAQVTAGGPYQLKNGSECIATGAAGANLVVEPCDDGAEDQLFYLNAAAGSTFTVQSEANGEVFDVTGAGTAAGTALLSWPSNNQDNQRFAFPARGAAYELRPAHATDRCVAAESDNSVKLAVCDGGATSQAWDVVEVEIAVPDKPRDCATDELYQPRFVENGMGGPTGANAVIMTGGYMMVLFANDSGGPPGILHFYDVSDPRHAVLEKRITDEHTDRFREAHSLPVAIVGDNEYVAIQTIDGMQFWDLSDPLNASYVSQIDLPGVSGGDYENVAWQADWQGRYLYVAGANQGIYVVDTIDIENPELLVQVPTGQTGGFRIGPLFARGSYLVAANMDQNGAISVLDISRPATPALLGTIDGLPRLYAITATGDRIYGAGRDGDFTIHSFEDPTTIEEVKTTVITQDSLYVAAQDHFVFSGRQNNFVKIDVADEMNPMIVGEGELGRSAPDHGQVTPIGNWIFVGNDHGSGSAFFCHAESDDLPLAVEKIFPADGATHQDPLSHVTIVFSDYVDTATVTPENVSIRPSGGEPLEGIYTYNFNTLSFSPNEPFAENTTIEIALGGDGVKDVSGNPLGEDVIVRFSTGDDIVIVEPPPMVEPDAGPMTGGTGGTGGAGGMPAMDGGLGTDPPGASGGSGGAGGMSVTPSSGAGGTAGIMRGPGDAVDASDCSCRVGRRASATHPALWASLAGLALVVVRSRRRRSV